MADRPRMATCSYSTFRSTMGVPVWTSIGSPKWLEHQQHETLKVVMPWGILSAKGLTEAEQIAKYRAYLDEHEMTIDMMLQALEEQNPGQTLVFLCFENVWTPGKSCHRRWLAEWLEERYGIDVPELSQPPREKVRTVKAPPKPPPAMFDA